MNFYHLDDIPEHLKQYFRPAPQIGLEPTPEAFIAKMVEVYREVRRVLRSDGTCWMNLGDSYSNSRCGPQGESGQMADRSVAAAKCRVKNETRVAPGLKPKDLCGIPWRVALALQADGWWLRQDIVWHKPNPMPESVTDRCTKSHEYIFLLTKSARYHYDAEAVKEPSTNRPSGNHEKTEVPTGGCPVKHGIPYEPDATRNKRSVWTIATQPYPEAHFATFPEAIPETCILAGTSPKVCGVCATPWKRGGKALEPSCDHYDDTGKCLVLDPFLGSGTTLAVAARLGCKGVGCELNTEYVKLAVERIEAEAAQLKMF